MGGGVTWGWASLLLKAFWSLISFIRRKALTRMNQIGSDTCLGRGTGPRDGITPSHRAAATKSNLID